MSFTDRVLVFRYLNNNKKILLNTVLYFQRDRERLTIRQKV